MRSEHFPKVLNDKIADLPAMVGTFYKAAESGDIPVLMVSVLLLLDCAMRHAWRERIGWGRQVSNG